MQKTILLISFLSFCMSGMAQEFTPKEVKADSTNFENVYVKKLAEDQTQSTFVIWVKKGVKPHYHKTHTEYIHVVSGRGIMTLGKKQFKIKKGSAVLIPKGEVHGVVTTSKKPLKVISIQAPKFDGDRIWVE